MKIISKKGLNLIGFGEPHRNIESYSVFKLLTGLAIAALID
jgi:hypothetical protein